MQLHLRLARSAGDCEFEANEGFVCISSARMAESRSDKVEAAPCMFVPPEIATFVFAGAGEDVLEGLGVAPREAEGDGRRSEMSEPDADGGNFGVEDCGAPPDVSLGS